MQSLEDTEEFVGKLHVKPNAVVTNIDRGSLRGYTAADLDAGTVTSAGELDRIAQQVGEDLFNECGVALNGGQRFDLPVDAASTGGFGEVLNKTINKRTERNRLTVDVETSDVCKIQQVVDQLAHAFSATLDAREVTFGLVGEFGGKIGAQYFR